MVQEGFFGFVSTTIVLHYTQVHNGQPKTPRQIEYQKYLESDHWKALRARVLERDGQKCTRCPSRVALQAHHKLYRARFEDSIPDDLITLCRDCHEREHGISTAKPIAGQVLEFNNKKELEAVRAAGLISRPQFLNAKKKLKDRNGKLGIIYRKHGFHKLRKRRKPLTSKEWKIRNKYAGWAETAFRPMSV